MKRYTDKLKSLFFNTKHFFDTIKGEKSYFQILKFFIIFYVIYQIIDAILLIPAVKMLSQTIARQYFGLLFIFGIIFGLIIAVILPFISAALTHIGILMVGGKQGFFNTFKPMTYALTITVVYNIISSFVSFFLNLAYPIDPSILQKTIFSFHDMPLPNILVGIIILLLSIIHATYAEIIGISKFQKISKLKAFFGAIIIPLIIVIFVMLLLITTFGLSIGIINKFSRI